LHLWWARRPLAAARAVIFAQLVNDPGYQQGGGFKYGKNKKEAAVERKRLFKIIEDLVLWENTTNEEVLERARAEIRRSWREVCELNKDHPQAVELFNPDRLPALHDPFAGGGAIPLEAQRLGLEAYASDLNPVAVLINKAMIEIPPKFAGRPPVHPSDDTQLSTINSQRTWPGATGLAEDVRYYGAWMREEAQKRIGHLYPPVEITAEMAKERLDLKPLIGQKLTVIAWLWARTVKSPNPAFSHVDVPLASTFILSSKAGKESYVQPIIEGDHYRFTVKNGTPPPEAEKGTKLSRGANFRCIVSDTGVGGDYIKAEGMAGRMGAKLMAIVAEGARSRIYLAPTEEMETIATQARPTWKPELAMPENPRWFSPPYYGLTTYGDLFTPRQLVALTTFSDLVGEARERIRQDAEKAWVSPEAGVSHEATKARSENQKTTDHPPSSAAPLRGFVPSCETSATLDQGGTGPTAYAEAVSVYLAFAVDRLAMTGNNLVRWNSTGEKAQHCFGRQALPMMWDFAEPNFLGTATGSMEAAVFYSYDPIIWLPTCPHGTVLQSDAQTQTHSTLKVISTDPPYYDNIGYADLSDFFYVWLRKSLRGIFPSLLSTIAVPKAEELVATPYRHGSKEKAESFFLDGMTQAMSSLSAQAHPAGPITIYYAFKQSDTQSESGTSSTGWETFLEAVHIAGLQLLGTWPLRTEMKTRQIAMGTNALASSIVLVCRKRPADAPTTSRREFQRELNAVLPEALDNMTRGNDEGRSMKDEGKAGSALHPSSFILHPSSFILHPSSFILHHSYFPHRAGGFVAGHHRPRHGRLLQIRRRAGGGRFAHERPHRAPTHQSLPRRGRF